MGIIKDVTDSGAGLMTKLGTATVAGAAATTLTLSGLDLSAYSAFKVVGNFKNATGSNANIRMYYNGDTTATNYHSQLTGAVGAATTNNRANDGIIAHLTASDLTSGFWEITVDVDGKPRAFSNNTCRTTTSIEIRSYGHLWVTAANVTSITLSGSVASSLAIGSTFTVYGIT